MSNKKYTYKDLLSKILWAELEREKRLKELSDEVGDLTSREVWDDERISEIIEELAVINPLPDEDNDVNVLESIKSYKKKRRNKLIKSISSCAAAFIAVIASAQIIAVVAFDIDFIGWTKNKFLSLIGIEIQQDNINHRVSGSTEYDNLEEFETAENIKIMNITWLPGDIQIKSIEYSYSYDEKQIVILYSDNITSLIIRPDSSMPEIMDIDNSEIQKVNDITYYIFTERNIIWWEYNGDFYSLACGFDISGHAGGIIENIK